MADSKSAVDEDGDDQPDDEAPPSGPEASKPPSKRRHAAAPAAQSERVMRYLFWLIWFFLIPLGLAYLSVLLLKPSDPSGADGGLDRIRYLVHDQPVPAGIVLFTLFEMLLYHYRYSLPLADRVGIGGRRDLPTRLRRDFEQAAHLLEEADRILDRYERDVQREVPRGVRDKLDTALEDLRDLMQADAFDEQRFNDAFDHATRLVGRHLGQWQKGEFREYAESIGIAVAVALLLRAFVVEAFKIPSGSMLPTLQIQDHIFVNKFAYGPTIPFTKSRLWKSLPPKRGDVMVFEYPDPDPSHERQDFIKRVIALPGDTMWVDNGHPIINGWRVPNCEVGNYEYTEGADTLPKRGQLFVEFLGEYSYLTLFEEGRFDGKQGPYKVADSEVWVLGDNRNNSSDSRAWNNGRGGGAPFQNIKGRAMFVWLSFGTDGNVTWDRLFHRVLGPPVLPKGAEQELLDAIQACVAKRPANTLPPAPVK